MRLYLDIETIGCDDAAVRDELAAAILPPRTMSKAETIAKWEAEEKPALIEEALRKTSFDGALGRVVCIGFAINDGPIQTETDADERALLVRAFAVIEKAMVGMRSVRVIGHNVAWDVRFLWQRGVIQNVKPPQCLLDAVKAKPWDIEDTMLMWNPERDRKVTLERLCKALSVDTPKAEMDGSKVWDAYREGRLAAIADYCKHDVRAVRECHQRLTWAAA
jgi:hypothetical protein